MHTHICPSYKLAYKPTVYPQDTSFQAALKTDVLPFDSPADPLPSNWTYIQSKDDFLSVTAGEAFEGQSPNISRTSEVVNGQARFFYEYSFNKDASTYRVPVPQSMTMSPVQAQGGFVMGMRFKLHDFLSSPVDKGESAERILVDLVDRTNGKSRRVFHIRRVVMCSPSHCPLCRCVSLELISNTFCPSFTTTTASTSLRLVYASSSSTQAPSISVSPTITADFWTENSRLKPRGTTQSLSWPPQLSFGHSSSA